KDITKTWNGKLSGTLDAGWGVRFLPSVRYQAGTPFGPTFTARLNYASVSIKAAPDAEHRNDNITLVDLRTERNFNIKHPGGSKVSVFLDLYNILNNNGVQAQP